MSEKCFLCKKKFEDGDETIEFFGGYAHYACFDNQMKKNELDEKKYVECPRCHGKGEIMVRDFAIEDDGSEDIGGTPYPESCPRCNGEGKVEK